MPKYLLILLCLIVTQWNLSAQITTSTDSMYIESTMTSPGYGLVILYNHYDEEKTIVWERNIDCISDTWLVYIQDEMIAYAPPVFTYQLPLAAGDSTFLLVSILDQGMPGEAIVELNLRESDQEEFFASTRFYFNIEACLTATETLDQAVDIKIGPNPSRDYLFVESPQIIHMEFFNANGQMLKKVTAFGTQQIDINTFESGLYYMTLKDDTGKILDTRKLLKL